MQPSRLVGLRTLQNGARTMDHGFANDVALWDGTCAGVFTVGRWLLFGGCSPEGRLPALVRRQTKWSLIESLLAVDVIVIVIAAGEAEHEHYFHFMGYFLLLLLVSSCRVCGSLYVLFARSDTTELAFPPRPPQEGSAPLGSLARWYVTRAFFVASRLLVVTNAVGLVHVTIFILDALQSKQEHEANVALLSLFVPLIVAAWSLSKNILFCLDNWRAQMAQRSFLAALTAQEAAAALRAAESKLLLKSLVESRYRDLDEKLAGSTTCLICLEEFAASDKVVVLPCHHVFHLSCARSWLYRETRCPLRCALTGCPTSPRCPPQLDPQAEFL
jgi:hypothetical protein